MHEISRNDTTEIRKAKTSKESYLQANLQNLLHNGCEQFISERAYIMNPLTLEEENFPFAYSMVVFTEFAELEKTFEIYRPQNVYCIHVDLKSDNFFKDSIKNISSCFDNEFPLRTNYELVRILTFQMIYVLGNKCNNLQEGIKIIGFQKGKSHNSIYILRPIKKSHIQANLQKLFEKGCEHFISERGYIMDSLTLEEKDFPIAYSIMVFKDFVQFERLLRAIYRPQNYYCIHVDLKSDNFFRTSVINMSSCFDNVFLSSRSIYVVWGKISVLEADLICMEDLWKYKKWKYLINLTGQEFPLRTN
ncbi:hypothetical protein KUTeg_012376 [Tegillarca granosa]|uniref:Uncharacterized protein n=1 Tax=Tegillarca granosa TaxID=220873 RepID=A0ABQ9F2T5_TEGGR|nr:hypothetical protein KUTeg_012376 [Tegillarca granosa]